MSKKLKILVFLFIVFSIDLGYTYYKFNILSQHSLEMFAYRFWFLIIYLIILIIPIVLYFFKKVNQIVFVTLSYLCVIIELFLTADDFIKLFLSTYYHFVIYSFVILTISWILVFLIDFIKRKKIR